MITIENHINIGNRFLPNRWRNRKFLGWKLFKISKRFRHPPAIASLLRLYDINTVFSIDIKQLTSLLIYQDFFIVKLFIVYGVVTLDHLIYCPVVISAYFLVRHPAVLLGGFDARMA